MFTVQPIIGDNILTAITVISDESHMQIAFLLSLIQLSQYRDFWNRFADDIVYGGAIWLILILLLAAALVARLAPERRKDIRGVLLSLGLYILCMIIATA